MTVYRALRANSRRVSVAVVAVAFAALTLVICYGLFLAGPAHLGLEAEFLADDELRVTYVMPGGLAYDSGIKPGDILLDATGGTIVQRGSSMFVKNPSVVLLKSPEGERSVSASSLRILDPTDVNMVRGLSFLFAMSASLALVVRSWDSSSWRLFVVLYSIGFLMALAPVSGQCGGLFFVIVSALLVVTFMHAAVSWLSSFPYRPAAPDWRTLATRCSWLTGLAVAVAVLTTTLLAPNYHSFIRGVLGLYVLLTSAIVVAELFYSTRRFVSSPRREQAKWLTFTGAVSLLPALLFYVVPLLFGTPRLLPPTLALVGVGFLPVGTLSVVNVHQMTNTGKVVVTWLLRIGALYVLFTTGALITATLLRRIPSSSYDLSTTAYSIGGLIAILVAFIWLVYRLAEVLGIATLYRPMPDDSEIARRARDQERRRLSHELHDGALQTAVGLSMLAGVSNAAPALTEGLRKVAKEIRLIVDTGTLGPPPGKLDDMIEQLGRQVERSSEIAVVFSMTRVDRLHRLPVNKTEALFRVAREALSNVTRHSGASEASLEIICTDAAISIRVHDNGGGFNPASLWQESYVPHGLALVREGIEALGGDMSVASSSGKGTAVEARMPL